MKKILLLFVALLATTTVWAANYITDVMVIGGSKSEVNSLKTTYTNQGWTVIDKDLNDGCGSSSDYIYLLYKSASETSTSATFITDFLISTATTPPSSFMNNGRVYNLVSYDGSDYFKNNKGDLNSHCGSNSATIHLYYTKDYADDLGTVRSITFSATQAGGVPVAGGSTGYDLNAGAGGDYIYMHAEKSQGWTYTKNSAGTQCYINGYDGPKANITSITIPTTLDGAQVANFTGSVFSGFTNLETMIFNENTIVSQMPSVNGLTKFKNVKTSNSLGNNNTPPSMTSIPASTFEGTAVMVINLTAVTSIGNYAFKGCGSLKDVYVSSTLNTIGKQVFYNCSSMAHLWFDGTEAQWNAVSKDSQWRTGAANFAEHWHCTVTFNANGHGTAPAAQTIWSNYDKATEPTAPTAPLCAFQGWYTDAACTNQWNFNTVVPGNMTLYAKWNTQYTYNSSTGALTLNWGEFNKDNKWGSDVPASSVQSVTATNQVSFTGDCSELFKDFTNCTSMDLNSVNTSNVTNMRSMFENCRGLSLINISNWNTGNVTNMSRMFYNCTISSYPLNISNWNTSNVTDMSWMFSLCKLLYNGPLNLSGWDTGNVTDISFMFYSFYSSYPLDLSGWNTSKVTNMTNMFMSCTMIPSINLAGWDTGNVTNMNIMFSGCAQLTTIYVTTSWSTANAITSSAMFSACNNLVGGMGTTFDSNYIDKTYARIDHGTSQPGYLTGVFKLTLPGDVTASPNPIFTLSGNKYYTAGTTVTLTYNGNVPEGKIVVFKVNGTAIEGNTFEMPLNDVTITATVTDPPQYTFNSETGVLALLWGEFNKDNKWGSDVPASSVKSVTATSQVSFTGDCSELFKDFTKCTSMDLDSVNTSNATNMSNMFEGCGAFRTLNISNWDTGNVTNMCMMFNGCSMSLSDTLDLSNWNTGNVTNMSGMFNRCFINLHPLNISGWDTGNVTTMSDMFQNFQNRYPLDLSGWNTSKVTDMTWMFMVCSQTPSINLSGWDTGNVMSMLCMFQHCGQLTTIYVTTGWSTENVEYSNYMFTGCNKLVGGMGTTYDENHINKEYGHIDHGAAEPGYLTGVFKLTLPGDVTASPNPFFTQGDTAYYTAGTTVTLTYNGEVPEGKVLVFAVNGTAIEGNTFEMPLDNVTITVIITDPPQYTFNSETGELALLWGEFNRDNKWGDDVPTSEVTSVTANNGVSFTGDCSELFQGFSNCTSFDLNSVNTSNVTNMANMFTGCVNMATLDLSNWDTGNVTNMKGMFLQCTGLDSLDISNFNTANVTNMSLMMHSCTNLKELNVSGWDTGNVTDFSNLFTNCQSLTTLDLSGWSVGKATTTTIMFVSCRNLTTIYVDRDWNIGNSTTSYGMFGNCYSLVGGKGTTYDDNHVDAEYARIDGGPDCPGYFTDANPVVVPGDVNGDGEVTASDITALYTFLLAGDMSEIANGDQDGDGEITTHDVTVVYEIMLGIN